MKRLNPRWNDEDKSTDVTVLTCCPSACDFCVVVVLQGKFLQAMELTGSELVEKIRFYYESWLPARTIVERAIEERFQVRAFEFCSFIGVQICDLQVDGSGEIICFQVGGCPWNDHLFQIEKEQQLEGVIKFALFQDESNKWRVQAVPVAPNSFVTR